MLACQGFNYLCVRRVCHTAAPREPCGLLSKLRITKTADYCCYFNAHIYNKHMLYETPASTASAQSTTAHLRMVPPSRFVKIVFVVT